jgi:hypothetical protein
MAVGAVAAVWRGDAGNVVVEVGDVDADAATAVQLSVAVKGRELLCGIVCKEGRCC